MTDNKPHQESEPNDPEADKPVDALSERMAQLKAKLEQTQTRDKQKKDKTSGKDTRNSGAIAQAFRLSSEFIAGVLVGAGLGYGFDVYFGTSPWGMIIFLLLGFAAAVLNVMRAAGLVAESKMRLKPAQELQNKRSDDDSGPEVQK